MKKCISLGMLISLSFSLFAQATDSKSSERGIWYHDAAEDTFHWDAQWIWLGEDIQADAMLARKSFEVTNIPKKAILRISASTQYQLFINGKYVARGPSRCIPHHQSYDIWKVADLLQQGKNTIAIRVHFLKEQQSYHHLGRPGLLTQFDIQGEEPFSIISDAQWKVSPDPTWDDQAPAISRFQLFVSDRVDLRKTINKWESMDFDDGNWDHAQPLMRNVGWPSPQKNANPQALTPPWTYLLARDVPYLSEENVKPERLIQAVHLPGIDLEKPISLDKKIAPGIDRVIESFFHGGKAIQLTKSEDQESWFLLFDFGEIKIGMPQLDIQGPAGTLVHILNAPYIIDQQFTHKIIASEFRDLIILSGKRDQWEATYFKPTRYLGLVVQGNIEELSLYSVGIHTMAFPFERRGKITSQDAPWVETYMNASARTIEVCTTDGYTDNYRERRQYAQTGYYAALGNYWTFGDHSLQRRYLSQVAQEQQFNGMMPAYAPLSGKDYMIILDSNCLWIRSLRNYFLYSGDEETTRALLPAAQKLMQLLHSYTHQLGFIYDPPYPYWLDHALLDRRGANFCLNGHYLGALEDFAEVLDWLGETDGYIYQERADLLRQSLQTYFWDEQRGLFVDAWIAGEQSDMFSEHSNAMALAENIATTDQSKRMIPQLLIADDHNYIKRASGMVMVTPAMSYFLHKGLANYGFIDESFQMFRSRFDKMLGPETNGTLWEEWWLDGTGRSGKFRGGFTRSDAQTESAFPPALFGEFLLGANPIKPGMKEIEISLMKSSLKNVSGVVPTPEGPLHIDWDFQNHKLALEIPEGIQVKLNVESMELSPSGSISINRKKQNISDEAFPYITLERGTYQVDF